jgi:hypothetical protein
MLGAVGAVLLGVAGVEYAVARDRQREATAALEQARRAEIQRQFAIDPRMLPAVGPPSEAPLPGGTRVFIEVIAGGALLVAGVAIGLSRGLGRSAGGPGRSEGGPIPPGGARG